MERQVAFAQKECPRDDEHNHCSIARPQPFNPFLQETFFYILSRCAVVLNVDALVIYLVEQGQYRYIDIILLPHSKQLFVDKAVQRAIAQNPLPTHYH